MGRGAVHAEHGSWTCGRPGRGGAPKGIRAPARCLRRTTISPRVVSPSVPGNRGLSNCARYLGLRQVHPDGPPICGIRPPGPRDSEPRGGTPDVPGPVACLQRAGWWRYRLSAILSVSPNASVRRSLNSVTAPCETRCSCSSDSRGCSGSLRSAACATAEPRSPSQLPPQPRSRRVTLGLYRADR